MCKLAGYFVQTLPDEQLNRVAFLTNYHFLLMWSAISAFILKVIGWRTTTATWPLPPSYVLIVIPHTSNWDFPLGLLVRSAMKLDVKYAGKASLFRPPFGAFFRWLGGYPVDRSKRSNFVDAVADVFRENKNFSLCIAPEGTRSRVDKLKTGFYYIAKGAGVPILLCKFDYAAREVSVSAPFYTTEDVEADFAFIDNYFRGVKGKNPEQGYLYEPR